MCINSGFKNIATLKIHISGYRATAREVFAICLSGGTWSTSEIQCREVSCRHPGTPQNGMLIGDRFIFGSRVVIACNRGLIKLLLTLDEIIILEGVCFYT